MLALKEMVVVSGRGVLVSQAARALPAQLLALLELDYYRPTDTPHTKLTGMATRTCKAKASLPDDRIDISNRNAREASSAKQVFRAASAAIALVWVSAPILHPSMAPLITQPGQDG